MTGSGTSTHAVSQRMQRVLDFVADFYRDGNDGKIVAVGYRSDAPVAAFALGLSDETQTQMLEAIARVTFGAQGADAYVVAIPAWAGEGDDPQARREVVVLQAAGPEGRYLSVCAVERDRAGVIARCERGELQTEFEPLVSDLCEPMQRVPGRLRAAVEQAYQDLRIDLDRHRF